MSNWIGSTVKQLWNYAMHVLHNFLGLDTNTIAFCLGQYSLHLLLLKSSMIKEMPQSYIMFLSVTSAVPFNKGCAETRLRRSQWNFKDLWSIYPDTFIYPTLMLKGSIGLELYYKNFVNYRPLFVYF